MPEKPAARLLATDQGLVHECPVCGEHVGETTKVTSKKVGRNGKMLTSEHTDLASDNYSKHYEREHA